MDTQDTQSEAEAEAEVNRQYSNVFMGKLFTPRFASALLSSKICKWLSLELQQVFKYWWLFLEWFGLSLGPLGNVRLTNRSGRWIIRIDRTSACECGRYLDINTEIFEHQTFTLCEIYLSCSRRNPLLDSRSIWYVLRHNISKLIPSWHDCPTFITPTFLTSDIHHPLPEIRRSSPQTFITPYLKSDIHHLRRSSPPT